MKYEDSQCCALMEWAHLQSAAIPDLRTLIHIPNGGSRNVKEAAKLKRMGVKAGVWDFMLASPRVIDNQFVPGLWIEMKSPKEKLRDTQEDWGKLMVERGWATAVCYDWEQAKVHILEYLMPVRNGAHVGAAQ